MAFVLYKGTRRDQDLVMNAKMSPIHESMRWFSSADMVMS